MNRSQTILVVSSRAEELEGFCEQLRSAEKNVLQVTTADTALQTAADTAPLLAVIDHQVHDVPGLEIVRRLLRVNAFIHTAFLSAMDEQTFEARSEGLGVLAKLPVTPDAEATKRLIELLDQTTATITNDGR